MLHTMETLIIPGVTHCGKYIEGGRRRCRNKPNHPDPCKPDIFKATYEAVSDD